MRTAELEKQEVRRFRREHLDSEEESSGLFGSIRRVLGVTLAVFQSRIELLTVEVKELKGRALAIVAWGTTLVFLSFLTLVAIMATVVFALWDQALGVLAGFSGFFVVVALGSLFMAKGKLAKIPLDETVSQLKKDRELVAQQMD